MFNSILTLLNENDLLGTVVCDMCVYRVAGKDMYDAANIILATLRTHDNITIQIR